MGHAANLIAHPDQDLAVMGSSTVYRGLLQFPAKSESTQQSKLASLTGLTIKPISQVPFKYGQILLTASAWDFLGLAEK